MQRKHLSVSSPYHCSRDQNTNWPPGWLWGMGLGAWSSDKPSSLQQGSELAGGNWCWRNLLPPRFTHSGHIQGAGQTQPAQSSWHHWHESGRLEVVVRQLLHNPLAGPASRDGWNAGSLETEWQARPGEVGRVTLAGPEGLHWGFLCSEPREGYGLGGRGGAPLREGGLQVGEAKGKKTN